MLRGQYDDVTERSSSSSSSSSSGVGGGGEALGVHAMIDPLA